MSRRLDLQFPFVILVLAAVVRFMGFPDVDYHHDEMSALLRTHYDSFEQLVMEGIRVDGHPGFTQWFLWWYAPLVNYVPFWVKLPFILAGLGAVWLTFEVGRLAVSKRVGWLASGLMAVSQYAVIYSQWARPYAFGMLFLLAAVHCLWWFVRSNTKWPMVIYAILAALTGYTHYFALLQLIIVSVGMAWFVMPGRQRLVAVIAGLTALLLWLPHLSITLHHLHLAGIGDWLQPPKPGIWKHLLGLSFSFSWWLALPLLVSVLILTVSQPRSWKSFPVRFHWLAYWLIPLLIAYWYSHVREPLLHEGTMYFTLPFFFLFAATCAYQLDRNTVKVLVVLVGITGVWTLEAKRAHTSLNLHTEYQDPFRWAEDMRQRSDWHGEVVADIREDAVGLLQRHGGLPQVPWTIIDQRDQSIEDWVSYLEGYDAAELIVVTTVASPPELIAEAFWRFPNIKEMHCYRTATGYLLSKDGPADGVALADTAMQFAMADKTYGPVLDLSWPPNQEPAYLAAHAWYVMEPEAEANLVVEWKAEGDTASSFWHAVKMHGSRSDKAVFHSVLGVDVRDLPRWQRGGQLKCYVWNPQKRHINLDFLQWERFPVNPVRYGLFSEMDSINVSTEGGPAKKLF